MYYFMRSNKEDNYLLTSYANDTMAKRVAGMEKNSSKKKFWEGEMFFDLKTGKYGEDASGVALRSYMEAKGQDGTGGRFAVFSINSDGTPNDLGLRFKEMGAANTFMKAVCTAYGKLFVLEMEKVGVGSALTDVDEDIEISENAPF